MIAGPGGSATADFQLVGGINLNGIDATPDGKTLVVVQSATGKLFSVAAATGVLHGGAGAPGVPTTQPR